MLFTANAHWNLVFSTSSWKSPKWQKRPEGSGNAWSRPGGSPTVMTPRGCERQNACHLLKVTPNLSKKARKRSCRCRIPEGCKTVKTLRNQASLLSADEEGIPTVQMKPPAHDCIPSDLEHSAGIGLPLAAVGLSVRKCNPWISAFLCLFGQIWVFLSVSVQGLFSLLITYKLIMTSLLLIPFLSKHL